MSDRLAGFPVAFRAGQDDGSDHQDRNGGASIIISGTVSVMIAMINLIVTGGNITGAGSFPTTRKQEKRPGKE